MTEPSTDDAVRALRELAMPVVIVGAADAAGPCGATATAMYTSLDPVELTVSLVASSRTARAVQGGREASVSVLGADLEGVAVRMAGARDTADKWADAGVPATWVEGWTVPAVAGATAFWGRLVATVPTGDHLLMVVRVGHAELGAGASGALVRFRRGYTRVEPGLGEADLRYPL